jgi:ubiquinone/menaquinone biosynthesis C-methylase UbiE
MEHNERWDEIWQEKSRVSAGRIGSILARDVIYRTVVSILRREIPDTHGTQVLETGSGTGLVSLDLAGRGADVFLLDLSPDALRLSKAAFEKAGTKQEGTQADILNLPYKDNAFDVTWSGGVIEHFEQHDQIKILDEMLRVTRPGGKVVVIAPSSEARIYMVGKRHADRNRRWQPGYEVPIASLEAMKGHVRGELVSEYRIGLMAELHFLKYYFAWSRFARAAWCGFVEILSLLLFPLNSLPGYLLVSVWKP